MTRNSPFPRHFKQVHGVTPDEIGLTLADFAMGVPKDQEIVELGVFHGRTALLMAWGAQQGNGAHVTAIDPWEMAGNVYGTDMGDLSEARRWARHWTRSLGYSNHVSLIQSFSHNAAKRWAIAAEEEGQDGRKVGLLFVDGDHTAEGARRDIETWAPHLAPGATIAIDDYVNPNYPGVAEAVDALVSEGLLEPVQVFHDRLAVTRLLGSPQNTPTTSELLGEVRTPAAITSEGVSPSPVHTQYPAAEGQVAVPAGKAETVPVGPAETMPFADAEEDELFAEIDDESSTHGHHGDLKRVGLGEAMVVQASVGQPIGELSIPNLKALAKHRGIVLGARKDKRDQILQALEDGR